MPINSDITTLLYSYILEIKRHTFPRASVENIKELLEENCCNLTKISSSLATALWPVMANTEWRR